MSEQATGNGALVRVENVAKIFHRRRGSIHVLDDLSLHVASKEFLALMGPSGSGKSTLLNLIGGLDRPTKGSVMVGETALTSFPRPANWRKWRARHVGFVFQLYNLMPVLSAERNVDCRCC